MKALDRVYNLISNSSHTSLSTEEIAEKLSLSRSVVSGYLSKLFKEGRVEKTSTRPVYWTIKKETEPFDNLIGYNGSLKEALSIAKQTIVYPPNGFPVIITGPSGVGKSLLAKKIFEEAKSLKKISSTAPFVTLNTADYANNAELLSSVLFGYKKGAFTGATADTPGLLDKADNGYLFLDEVHRLSKTNQEKLFSVFDNGTFYPLGETEHPHHVNVRLIFATTESLEKYLLKTFLRRIPVQIELPSLMERPIIERMELVVNCFKQEAARANVTYLVNPKLIIDLANQKYKANIGSLRNRVKRFCSHAYAAYPEETKIPIGPSSIDNIDNLEITSEYSLNQISLVKNSLSNNLILLQNELIEQLEQEKIHLSNCKLIVLRYLNKLSNFIEPVMTKLLKVEIQSFLDQELFNTYGVNLKLTPEDLDSLASAFALSLFYKEKLPKNDILIKIIKYRFPRSFYLYQKMVNQVLNTPSDSANFWFFLAFANISKKVESIAYSCILLAHGQSTAKGIQQVVNQLSNNYIFEAFDMSIDASVNDISKKVKEYLHQQGAKDDGVILLFDMGSLNSMFTQIKSTSNKQLLVINNLTTATALDIAMRVERKEEFEVIAKHAQNYGKYMGVQYFEGLSNQQNIIVSCLSGVGLSEAIQEIMLHSLSTKYQIITMDYRKLNTLLANHDEKFFKNTDLIVTTTDFKSDLSLPIINIYNILGKEGFTDLKVHLLDMGEDLQHVNKLMDKFLKFLTIQGVKDRLQVLNPNIVIDQVQDITEKYQKFYNVQFTGKIKLNLYMHLALMIERVLLNPSSEANSQYSFKDEQGKQFKSISNTIFKPIELKYNIKVNDFEISLIYELLKDYIY